MSEYVYCSDGTPLASAGGEISLPRERVVRCRDCKHFMQDNSDHDYRSGWWCRRWDTDMVKPDGFCAWGKPSEGEDK